MSTSPSRLPQTFTSLYRLFLRTCSASVLHHRAASRNLRRLWRPTFAAAAQIIRGLQNGAGDANTCRFREDWLGIWEKRVDNTLALLYTSCKSRGLPHKLVRNLGYLVLSEHQHLNRLVPKLWHPNLDPTSPFYAATLPATQKEFRKSLKLRQMELLDANAQAHLTQVIKLAEGREKISLGKITIHQRHQWRTGLQL